ncbi:DUF4388 domain-containing protein [bacterium]|nr:MAG: DUF4388 domain-containing protein [bacterium]
MALEGLLQEFGLADILQLIYFQKKTGVLNIEGKLDTVELAFIKGNIAGLKSQKRSEGNRLGRILMKKGMITRENLNAAVEAQKTDGTKIGNFFIRKALVSKEALIEIIQEQIIETIVQIFTWKEGRYEFLPQGIPLDKELPIYLDTQHLLMDGLRIVDEWSVIEEKLDLNTVFKRIGSPDPEELSDVEKEVLPLVDGDRDVMTIINVSDVGDFDTAQAIISLQEKQIIETIVFKPIEQPVISAEKKLTYQFHIAFYGIMVIIFIIMMKGNLDTFKTVRDTKASLHMEQLKNAIDIHYAEHSSYPLQLNKVVERSEDKWGRPYQYKFTPEGFVLFSKGPDGIEGTDDDVY